jgi:hypothetical protein
MSSTAFIVVFALVRNVFTTWLLTFEEGRFACPTPPRREFIAI